MAAARDDAATAFASMRGWSWRRCDPDGFPLASGMDLGSIINRLAIEGVRRPRDFIIQLLCQGDLVANGSYRWRKYQDLEKYQRETSWDRISAKHWQKLADAIQAEREKGPDHYFDDPLQLELLGLKDCATYGLDTHNSSFSYATVTEQLQPWDSDYFEEWFSAWNIKVLPAKLDFEFDESETEKAETAISRGGRPPAKWWPDFAEELAVFIHDEGLPDGSGHDGQSEVLDKVCARLSAAGKPEPGRATVQPVINAVLARIRSAGK